MRLGPRPRTVYYRGQLYELAPSIREERRPVRPQRFFTDKQKRKRPITPAIETPRRYAPTIEVRPKPEFARTYAIPPRRIDPVVSFKYGEWKRQYDSDRLHQRKRKNLGIGSLQNYVSTRRAAYIAEGGQPDLFNDEFDKVDIAVASDSWSDLDNELQDHHIFAREEDPRELAREARRHAKEEKEFERQYEEYQSAQQEQKRVPDDYEEYKRRQEEEIAKVAAG